MKRYQRFRTIFLLTSLLVTINSGLLWAQVEETATTEVADKKLPTPKKKARVKRQAPAGVPPMATSDDESGFSESEDADIKAKRKELQKLELENSLLRLKVERDLASLRIEIEKLRTEKEISLLRWDIEQEKAKKESQKTIERLNQEREKILAELALSQAKFSKALEEVNEQCAIVQNKLSLARAHADQLRIEIDTKKVEQERASYAEGRVTYLEEPLQKDGKLVVSDRKVALSGVITPWKANYIADQISYFNNKDSKKPIFLIIDNSPGGSAHACLQIVQAMKNSTAPVYVVVQSFAASAAAVITTLAKKSYIYPNATMLHHQPWTFTWGNIRQIKEELELIQEFWKRCGGELAKKMGISLTDLDKKLYEKSANGDWQEFGDNATKIKWVDHVISHVQDTGLRQPADRANYTIWQYYRDYYDQVPQSGENNILANADGKIWLPALAANDFYYLYNPHKIYQVIGSTGK